jgi:hypothetical protein
VARKRRLEATAMTFMVNVVREDAWNAVSGELL